MKMINNKRGTGIYDMFVCKRFITALRFFFSFYYFGMKKKRFLFVKYFCPIERKISMHWIELKHLNGHRIQKECNQKLSHSAFRLTIKDLYVEGINKIQSLVILHIQFFRNVKNPLNFIPLVLFVSLTRNRYSYERFECRVGTCFRITIFPTKIKQTILSRLNYT